MKCLNNNKNCQQVDKDYYTHSHLQTDQKFQQFEQALAHLSSLKEQ